MTSIRLKVSIGILRKRYSYSFSKGHIPDSVIIIDILIPNIYGILTLLQIWARNQDKLAINC